MEHVSTSTDSEPSWSPTGASTLTSCTSSVWYSSVPDVARTPIGHYDFISFLATTQKAGVMFLPLNWRPELEKLGLGGQGDIRQLQVTADTTFAFKRLSTTSRNGQQTEDSERRLFRALQSEVLILCNPSVRNHPNIVNLEAVCWDLSSEEAVMPVLVYEKSPFGDLRQFLDSDAGKKLNLQSKLDICFRIGKAIEVMHTISKSSTRLKA